jgi:hypothetical protein
MLLTVAPLNASEPLMGEVTFTPCRLSCATNSGFRNTSAAGDDRGVARVVHGAV